MTTFSKDQERFQAHFPDSKFTSICEVLWGSLRGETNPWAETTEIQVIPEFKYRQSKGKSNLYKYAINYQLLNKVFYLHATSTPSDPLFTGYYIFLTNSFKFAVYRQLCLDISPLLVGEFATYQKALDKCTRTVDGN